VVCVVLDCWLALPSWDEPLNASTLVGLLGLGGVLTALMLGAFVALFRRVLKVFDLREADTTTDDYFRNAIIAAFVFALFIALAFPLGAAAGGRGAHRSGVAGVGTFAVEASQAAAVVVQLMGFIVVVAFLSDHVLKRRKSPNQDWSWSAGMAALTFGLAAPWSQNGAIPVATTLNIPLWPVQALILWAGFRQWMKGDGPSTPIESRCSLLEMARSTAKRGSLGISLGRKPWQLPRRTRMRNQRRWSGMAKAQSRSATPTPVAPNLDTSCSNSARAKPSLKTPSSQPNTPHTSRYP
jgi:hypothetical protein